MKKWKIKLSDIFNIEQINNDLGIFSYLARLDSQTPPQPVFPLLTDFIDQNNYIILDYDYEVGYSADKYISPLLEKLLMEVLSDLGFTLEDFINGLSSSDLANVISGLLINYPLGEILYSRFGVKWKKIYDSLVASVYNPIHNYDMEEKRTPDLTRTETFNDVTDERTPDLSTTNNTDATSKTGVFGFNGTSAKDSATNDGTSDSTISVTGTDTNVKSGSIDTTESGTDTLTRKGNIGVTTSQQLIESELELRKHDFYRIIYNDIDSVLCLKIY